MVGWFLTPSQVKRAAVRPMARVGGLVALMLAAASAASAEPMSARGLELSASRLDLVVTGRIMPRCEISGGGDIDFGELAGEKRATALFGLDCNVPFDLGVQSARGGLAHDTQPQGEGPFAGLLPYDLTLTLPTRTPDPRILRENFSSLTRSKTISSGEGVSAGGGKIEFRTRQPLGVGLLAGKYSETLTVTVTPRV